MEAQQESWIAGHSVVVIHGMCMLAAFGFFFNVGSVLGRYFKKPPRDVFPGKWFPVHVTLQSTGLTLALTAAILIVLHLSYDKGITGHLNGIHQILGALVLIAVFIQPVLGTFAHRHFLRFRQPSSWHAPHRWVGRITMLVAILTMALGLHEISEHVVPIDAVMWFTFASILVVVTLMISYGEWSTPSEKTEQTQSVEMTALVVDDDEAMLSVQVRNRGRETDSSSDRSDEVEGEELKQGNALAVLTREIEEANTRRTNQVVLFIYTAVLFLLVLFMIIYISLAYREQQMHHHHVNE